MERGGPGRAVRGGRAGGPGGFCFVHAADLHLDTPFTGLSRTAPDVAAALREASLEAFDSLVRLCLDRRAAFLVVAGDVYDGAERGLRAQLRFREGLQSLSDAGIPCFVAHGNHDPVDEGWSAIGSWPELVHVFGSASVESVPVERDGRVIATVQGISYGQRQVTENLALRFSGRAGGGLQVGVLHCSVAGAGDGHAPYSPCTLAELLEVGLDYWALGHIHSRTVLSGSPFGGEPWVVYPGNLQGRSPKPSELGPKGATVVDVQEGRVASVEHVDCDRVRLVPLEVGIAGMGGAEELLAELQERAELELEAAQGRSLLLRGRLVGRGPLHGELARAGAVEDLLTALRDRGRGGSSFAWWERLDDESRSDPDLDELRGGDDFATDLLELASRLASGFDAGVLKEMLGNVPKELERTVLAETDGPAWASVVEESARTALDFLASGR